MSKIIPKNVLDDIRNQNDIVDVVSTYLPQLKRAGTTFKTLCPFHKEKTPSFTVNQQRQIYHCFGCGVGGDVFKFIQEYEGVDFTTSARILAQRVGIRLEFLDETRAGGGPDKDLLLKIHEEVAQIYHRALKESPAAKKGRDYLKERDLSDETVKEFLIGYAPDQRDGILKWARKKKYTDPVLEATGLIVRAENEDGSVNLYDRFRGRLMFPIRDELGRVIGFSGRVLESNVKAAKYVNSPETLIFKKGRVLYALDKARHAILEKKTALLCEGQIDVIRCHVSGLQSAVAAQGTALTDDHARLLKRYADEVVIVLDADKAGQDASLRSAEVLIGAGLSVSIAALPQGDDPDSLIRKQGTDALLKIIGDAQSVLDFQIGVLSSREDARSDAGLMRIARAVLETIGRAPTAVQREHMLQRAAKRLNLPAEALRQDLTRVLGAARRTEDRSPAKATTEPVVHPSEEVTLVESLVAHPELGELVRDYLPLDLISDPSCRTIIETVSNWAQDTPLNLTGELVDEDEECKRLAAQIQCTPPRAQGHEITPDIAVKDAILYIRRKALERERAVLEAQREKATGADHERLDAQCKQLTLDIKMMRGEWDKALPLLDL